MTNDTASVDRPKFSLARMIHGLTLTALMLSIALSLLAFMPLMLAAILGLALAYVFDMLVRTALGQVQGAGWRQRVGAALGALLVFGTSMGLSYSTLYRTLFAQKSALNHLQAERSTAMRALDTVLASATSAQSQFEAWSRHSSLRAQQEAQGGGSCPARAASSGKRGPIAIWREEEAAMADALVTEFSAQVQRLVGPMATVRTAKPTGYDDSLPVQAALNEAIDAARQLTQGPLVGATRDTLQRRAEARIQWANGESFACGDTVRDELLKHASNALEHLAKQRELANVRPAIDLHNGQDLTTRALLRSYNALLAVATLGHAGQFGDDPLMRNALKDGLINQETLGMFLAAILEFCVVLTAMISHRHGEPLFAFDPANALNQLDQQRLTHTGKTRLGYTAVLLTGRVLANQFWTRGQSAAATHKQAPQLPPLPDNAQTLAAPWDDMVKRLLPWWFAWNQREFVILPCGRHDHASLAMRSLCFYGRATLIGSQVSWNDVSKHRLAADKLQRLVPDARTRTYEVFELDPVFAQQWRDQLLLRPPHTAQPSGPPRLTLAPQPSSTAADAA